MEIVDNLQIYESVPLLLQTTCKAFMSNKILDEWPCDFSQAQYKNRYCTVRNAHFKIL